ncbi:MAG: ergothioneine biosynthesis protein EgtB [Ectothiorhodospiraceae bacterium]|nr:ergothioneine biosynthesis protein EgtB [Ectothiorhodospiraceae bacterium]MCH8505840.1 ergothioneine biosynthesis protein EgtB [Ectothiorhodospiraceae bacterium]
MAAQHQLAPEGDHGPNRRLLDRLLRVRATTEWLSEPLSAEDQAIQSMPDASPTKWHRAHTTWFFEEFVLSRFQPAYQRFHADYGYLFNSYYNAVGRMHPRPQRGMLSRPSVDEIGAYRAYVDGQLTALLQQENLPRQALELVLLGTHHEQQHQELLLTDIKHTLFQNPLLPAYRAVEVSAPAGDTAALRFIPGQEGVVSMGHAGDEFHFDNETPAHKTYLQPHAIAHRPASNAEYLAFIRDGGYRRPELWLSDGWSTLQQRGWDRPYYWQEDLETEFTLTGRQPLDPSSPVCHLSYYEADAFARWAGARLPTEAEWESFARTHLHQVQSLDDGYFHPRAGDPGAPVQHGGVWEWTASAYAPYPGFHPPPGAVGEYNGKFMCNQMVLRGGSCATPGDHLRTTYRNFFYPDARWQFAGVRLARDL